MFHDSDNRCTWEASHRCPLIIWLLRRFSVHSPVITQLISSNYFLMSIAAGDVVNNRFHVLHKLTTRKTAIIWLVKDNE